MNSLNYEKTHNKLLKKLPGRTRSVIKRRFGLEGEESETLESIGKSFGVCRERVRQIENSGINLIKREIKNSEYQSIFNFINDNLEKAGNLKREDLLVSDLTPRKLKNQTLFWLTLGDRFFRFSETRDIYPLWTVNLNSVDSAKKVIQASINNFEKERKLLSLNDLLREVGNSPNVKLTSLSLTSYLEISKEIEQDPEGLFGLKKWPEVSPKGVKDKAYLALKKEKKPLHFKEVAEVIDEIDFDSKSKTLPQTVHNELIRDPRFVLVGRGMYALKEWGYAPGQVKDVIAEVLRESKKPLSKDKIITKVLSRRIVKENTILLNLQNKDQFVKTPQGKYTLKEA